MLIYHMIHFLKGQLCLFAYVRKEEGLLHPAIHPSFLGKCCYIIYTYIPIFRIIAFSCTEFLK